MIKKSIMSTKNQDLVILIFEKLLVKNVAVFTYVFKQLLKSDFLMLSKVAENCALVQFCICFNIAYA